MKVRLYLLFLIAALSFTAAHAQNETFSQKLDTTFVGDTIRFSRPLGLDILCLSQDCTVYDPVKNVFAPMKGSFGTAWYLPGGFSKDGHVAGTVFVTHNTNEKNSSLGDGGGVIKFNVKRNTSTGKWEVVSDGKATSHNNRMIYYKNIDLGKLGGSVGCGDITGDSYNQNYQTILVSEGMLQHSNTTLASGMTNTSDYTIPSHLTQASDPDYIVPKNTVLPRYQQMNWMVQLTAASSDNENNPPPAEQKLYTMGRFNHAYCVKGGGGYYMTTGQTPSVLFKWVPNDPDNLQLGGELFFFKQNEDAFSPDEFISLNMHKMMDNGEDSTWQSFDSLLVAEAQALRAGATMFANLSGMAIDDMDGTSILYIAEKGIDDSGDAFTNPSRKYNGVLASHLAKLDAQDGSEDKVVHDYHGRILVYTSDGKMNVALEGGTSKDKKYTFSNPEGISIINGPEQSSFLIDKYFILKENINGIDNGRNPSTVKDMADRINEAYFVKVSKDQDPGYMGIGFAPKPITVDSLNLFMVGPKGTVFNGGSSYDFTGSSEKNDTYFVSMTNTNEDENGIKNRSMVAAVRGMWGTGITTSITKPSFKSNSNFVVWPNPVSGTLHFNKRTDVAIYNSAGIILKVHEKTDSIDVTGLAPGMYFITNKDGEIRKLIVE